MGAPKGRPRPDGSGKPEHEPTDESRAEVTALTSFGVTKEQIATYLDISINTLRKHYERETTVGKISVNAAMARRLYSAAMDEGSVAAMIFWLKCQGGDVWREKISHEHAGKDGDAIVHRIERVIIDVKEQNASD